QPARQPRQGHEATGGDAGRSAGREGRRRDRRGPQAAGGQRRPQPAHPDLQLPAGPDHRPPGRRPDPVRPAQRAHRRPRRAGQPAAVRAPGGRARAADPGHVMAPGDPRADLREAVRREPRNAMAWIVLADAELDAGDALAGQSACQQALALAPGHPEALARLGRAHWLQRRFPEAVASLRAAAGAAPRHPGIAVWLGHALEDAGEAEAAADAYATAHALAPDEPQLAAYLLAWRRRLCDWRDLDTLATQV